MSVLYRAPDRQRQGRAEPGLAAGEARSGRPSLDQQHRRHDQFRDARDRPAAARLRCRQARGRHPRAARATTDEEFLALDGRTYKLAPTHLVIADAERGGRHRRRDGRRGYRRHGRRHATSCSKARISCPRAFAAPRANSDCPAIPAIASSGRRSADVLVASQRATRIDLRNCRRRRRLRIDFAAG